MKPLFATTAAALLLSAALAGATTTSVNTGSLGAAANGTNSNGVTFSSNSPLKAPGDVSAVYGNGTTAAPVNTTIPFNPALNPAANQPFTVEFWVNPAKDAENGGWAPVFNRVTDGNRSGWTFFQRGATGSSTTGGWNFVMYTGVGSNIGNQITGGGSSFAIGTWTQVVSVWDGTKINLYMNGVDTGAVSTGGGMAYNVNSASSPATFSVGSYDTGLNSYFGGLVDETAFYSKALTPAQILAHYNAASSTSAGVYSNLVKSDGALLYLQGSAVPEPTGAGLAALGLLGLITRRSRRGV